jgi:PPOX class probable F420-dependent enzyme
MEIPEPVCEALLDAWPVARLATLAADGRPVLVPLVFARAGKRLWSPVDGKPKRAAAGRELARVANLRRDPRCSLLLDRYERDWRRLWWIRIDGEAEVVRGDPEQDAELAAAAQALRDKYPQYRATPLFAGPPTLLCLRPASVCSWCPGPTPPEVPRGVGGG